AKTLLHSTPEHLGIKIAHGNYHHIIGDIPGMEDTLHILGGDARKRLFKPNNGTAVGVRGEGQFEQALTDFTVWVVLATSKLFVYHFLLMVEIRGGEQRMQNGIAEHIKAGFPEAAGNGDVVD